MISIVITSIRPDRWQLIYNSFLNNKSEFEIIFVGPNAPSYCMPENVKYICTNVKPSQCIYIAVSAATGDYILQISDDVSHTENSLDHMLGMMDYCDPKLTVVSPINKITWELEGKLTHGNNKFWGGNPCRFNQPLLPSCLFFNRQLWDDLQGVDRNFLGLMWDLDFAMRVYERGGNVVMCHKVTVSDVGTAASNLMRITGAHDQNLFYSLWVKDYVTHQYGGPILCSRQAKFEPFEMTDDVLTVSQGPKGKWV